MTPASQGLRLPGARAAADIAAMSADDLLAQMTDDQRAKLGAALAPKANADMPGDEPEPADDNCSKCGDPMKDGKCSACEASASASTDAVAAAEAKGFATATQRALDVMASDHFKGRETQAAKLLANPKLGASEIIELLADSPDGQAAEMLEKMRGNNPDLGTGGAAEPGKAAAQTNHGWADIHKGLAKRFAAPKL